MATGMEWNGMENTSLSLSLYTHMYIYIYTYAYMYYIYIYTSLSLYIYIYIYMTLTYVIGVSGLVRPGTRRPGRNSEAAAAPLRRPAYHSNRILESARGYNNDNTWLYY